MSKQPYAIIKRLFNETKLVISISTKHEQFFVPKNKINKKIALAIIYPSHLNSQNNGFQCSDKLDPLLDSLENNYSVFRFIEPSEKNILKDSSYKSLNFLLTYIKFKRFINKCLSKENIFPNPKQELFGMIISRMKPSFVFGLASPEDLAQVAKKLGVCFVEPMHGWVNKRYLEINYGKNNKPDIFLAWSEYYRDLALSLGICSENIGFSHLLEFNDQSIMKSFEKCLLVSLSVDVKDSVDDFGTCTSEIWKLLLYANLYSSNFSTRVRFHYRAISQFGFQILNDYYLEHFPKLVFVNPHHESVRESILTSRLFIGFYTSLGLEASALGVQSYIQEFYDGATDTDRMPGEFIDYIDPNFLNTKRIIPFKTFDEIRVEIARKLVDQEFVALPPYTDDKAATYLEVLMNRNV